MSNLNNVHNKNIAARRGTALLLTSCLVAFTALPAAAEVQKIGLDVGDSFNQQTTSGWTWGYVNRNSSTRLVDFWKAGATSSITVGSVTIQGSMSGSGFPNGLAGRDYTGAPTSFGAADGNTAAASPIKNFVGDGVFNNSDTEYAIVRVSNLAAGSTVKLWIYSWDGADADKDPSTAWTSGRWSGVADYALDFNGDGVNDTNFQIGSVRTNPPTALAPDLTSTTALLTGTANGGTYSVYRGASDSAHFGVAEVTFTVGDSGAFAFAWKKASVNGFFNGMAMEVTTVPEAASLSLLACGGIALLGRSRK